MKTSRILSRIAIACLFVSSVAISASAANSVSPAQKSQIEGVVHDYLLNNPDVVVQSLQAFQEKQMNQARQTIKETQKDAPKSVDALFHYAPDPVAGNPNGKVTLVEFFDYQCPHCVDMSQIVDELISVNPDLRVVLKEFPIRGPVSEFASRATLAAKKQGKYYVFQQALMRSKQQPLTQDLILTIAQSVGINVAQLKIDMKDPSIDQEIKHTYQLAKALQLIGTPAFFVGKTSLTSKTATPNQIAFIPGQVDQAQLEEIIKKISAS
ncbi:MAG TPA: DsbA family protein, partial [Gammaproteobacteria bacterium]|nr:DsbA family protein [Gammaproteobacteria bacterium]